ncbi:hypothetical protein [Pseudomonas frederiksbergensis]|uniref:hypothetical protein n=1 Tax=Pseudomonas frederiksbergensis TaxID=104087 RepID=UPI003D1C05C2
MKIHKLTDVGKKIYREWLDRRTPYELPPKELLDEPLNASVVVDVEIDLSKIFKNRFEFGKYIDDLLCENFDAKWLLAQKNDGIWEWLTIAYFSQFGKKMSKYWHYSIERKGHSGSLAYRHLARTSFEMYWRHGPEALVMLSAKMPTWGDLSEQLTSRQNVVYHRAYIQTANAMYMKEGEPLTGAANRVKPMKKRKRGDTTGKGGVGRLALAVRRLSRTYDTHTLQPSQMMELLPREFTNFIAKASAK